MKKGTTNNSVILIATLGVYLGLLMAGAAPQVLATAAMTRQFDVRDEVEAQDDKQNKPDGERSPVDASVQIYVEDVEHFLSSLGRLQTRGQFDLAKDTFGVAQKSMQPCVAANIAGRYTPIVFEATSDAVRSSMESFSRGMIYGYSLGDCLHNNEFGGVTAVDSHFSYKLDQKEFLVNVVVVKDSPQRALALMHDLETTLRLYSMPPASKFRQQIIKNTRVRVQNDQIMVVTRLPRGSLRTLLASDAK